MSLFMVLAGLASGPNPPTILVVDDEPDIRQAVRLVLEGGLRAKVLDAGSGEAGLAILAKHQVDLIVTDFKMPGMNGVEFMLEARRLAPKAPMILITAFERELVEALEGSRGAQTILSKPLDPRPLLKTVQRALLAPA